MKVSIINYGCKVNQYESDSLIRALKERGFEVTDNLEPADTYIINTCAVTSEAERKSRQSISRVKKLNPDARVYIIGCAVEKNSTQFLREGVTYISGTAGKARLSLFEELEGKNILEIPKEYEDDLKPLSLRTRSYIKVQDGCNNFCSYCILPYIRGRSRSRSIESIRKELQEISESCIETVITGINLSSYGKDIGIDIIDLLRGLKGIVRRLRLGSLEVNVVNDEFLNVLKSMTEFCPHFHLSLQSGDDKVLKDMNRHYTTEEYLDKVNLIRKYFPDAAITTDIIVGFPTEDEEAFKNTLDFVVKAGFSDIHPFPYSRREGTKAYNLKTINGAVVKERMSRMERLKDELRRVYNGKFIGKQLEVLIEEENNGIYEGYSENYIKVYTKKAVIKDISYVTPQKIFKDGLTD